VSLEQRVPSHHPLRVIRKMVDEALSELSGQLDVEALRARNIVPHVAEYERGNLQCNSLRAEERNSAEFVQSQKKRKLVEQSFAWIKHWAGFRQLKLRSRRRVEWLFQIAAAAYNLVRMTRLRAAPV
jgi:hypothetical protein